MKKPDHIFLKHNPYRVLASVIAAILIYAMTDPGATHAGTGLQTINRINVNDSNTFEKMDRTVGIIASTLSGSLSAASPPDFEFQKAVLTRAGECVSKLVGLKGNTSGLSSANRQKKIDLFMKNREIIKKILELNEQIIYRFQEDTLDKLEDPLAFFQSSQWQNPQYLISLSSYWIGWNNYYATLYFINGGDERSQLLEEAIKGFSRAFVDFEEDSVVARSLFGRGLCYRQKKAFVQAVQDMELVKRKISRDDSLSLRCDYEVAWILCETGKYNKALNRMDDILETHTGKDLPEEIDAGLTAMRSKILIALSDNKTGAGTGNTEKASRDDTYILTELKKMASSYNGANELYRYTREHADRMTHLTPKQLGPIATVALGDALFEDGKPDDALAYYLPYCNDKHVFLSDRMDGVWFRIAYTYCKREKWDRALKFLAPFANKFSSSPLIPEIASLYYVAASSQYGGTKSAADYNTYIAAVRFYLNRCKSPCPHKSEAHFQMGKHYLKIGREDRAANEFNRVGNDSPNRFLAKYHALQYYAESLASLRKAGREKTKAWDKRYGDAMSCLKSYRSLTARYPSDKSGLKIAPHMAVLSAEILHYGNKTNIQKAISLLEGFETRYPGEKQLNLKAMVIRITGYYRLGMLSRVEADISRFISDDSGEAARINALHKLADNFFRDAQSRGAPEADKPYNMALAIYQKLSPFSCNPESPDRFCGMTLLRMAKIYQRKNRLQDAEAAYLNMMEINPSSADAVYGLGQVYEKMGDWNKSLAAWRKFSDGMAEGSPMWYESKYRTAQALTNLGMPGKACDILTITMVLHPDLKDEELTRKYRTLKETVCGVNQ